MPSIDIDIVSRENDDVSRQSAKTRLEREKFQLSFFELRWPVISHSNYFLKQKKEKTLSKTPEGEE